MATVDELKVLITANAASFNKQIQAVQHELDKVSGGAAKQSASVQKSFSMMKIAAAAAAAAIGVAIGKSVSAFGDFEQNVGGAKAIFGDYADFVQKKAMDAANTMGMSINEYMQTINKVGAIMQGSGLSQVESLKMTSEWMQRAADQASVMGVTTTTAMDAITAAAKGNFMLMDNIGVKMNATTIQAYALEKGITQSYEAMSEAQKVGLAYQLFLERTTYAAGNFAREGATTLNGSLATLKANFANLGTMLGSAFAPTLMQIAQFVSNYVIPAFEAAIPYIVGFMQVVGQAISYVAGALSSLFGGTSQVASEAGKAAEAVSEVATEASGVGSALDSATGSAKKLKQQLAGFDEMNVLTKQETGGGGGASGGGGGANAPSIDLSGFEFANPFDKLKDDAKGVFDSLDKMFKDFLKGFDFDKIGKAFKQFGKDAEKFLKPVGKILGDVWEYLKPFIYWVGNDLLPAFLNAIGGAISLVGSILSNVWDSYLKPFIDLFLVPIAQWTGGVIVSVLNAVGSALRWISEQQFAVELITSLGLAFGTLFVFDKIATWLSMIQQMIALQVALGTTGNVAIGGLIGHIVQFGATLTTTFTAAGGGFTGIQAIATTAATGIGTALTGLLNLVISPLGIAVLGLVAVFEGFRVIQEANKLATMQAELAEKMRMDTTKLATQAQQWYNDSIEESKRLLDELTGNELGANEAELAYINSMDLARQKRELYNQKVKEGTLSTEELRKAQLEAEIAEQRVEVAHKRLEEAQGKVNQTLTEYDNQQWKTIMSQKQGELATMAQQGKYRELAAELDKLAKSDINYTNAHGQNAKFNREDTQAMADFIGDQLAKSDAAFKQTWEAANRTAGDLGSISSAMSNQGNNSGANFQSGIASGIRNNQWQVNNAAKDSALGAQNAFNNNLKIRSPSRVMMESGGYFAEGVSLGISDQTKEVVASVASLANSATRAFEGYSLTPIISPTLSSPDIKDVAGDLAISTDKTPLQLTVNIGAENLLDRIVSLINEASFMQNRNIINL